MRGLSWLLPSVIAGSCRTAIVKSNEGQDFSGDMPQKLLEVSVAGVFPTAGGQLYFPAPLDALAEPDSNTKAIRKVFSLVPQDIEHCGCDFPDDVPLKPVMLSEQQSNEDFKPASIPAWWPAVEMEKWLIGDDIQFSSDFLCDPTQKIRDHVSLDPERGAAAEGKIFATSGLELSHLRRFKVESDNGSPLFNDRYLAVDLSARVDVSKTITTPENPLSVWHPLGGERRLVHWQACDSAQQWSCPQRVRTALSGDGKLKQIRLVLATPAIFKNQSRGWLPGWLNQRDAKQQVCGRPFESAPMLSLVGMCIGRWKAVSGWSLANPRGPKPIRRMVPAGSVYFFETHDDCASLANHWLRSVADDDQAARDGFGLALWGTWK